MKIFTLLLITLSLSTLSLQAKNTATIHAHGYWLGKGGHITDKSLGKEIARFFAEEQAESVVDFGCGIGAYVKIFREQQINAIGYDGNPNTPEVTEGLCEVLDLAISQDLGKKFDWVMSLEVGEHLPKAFEEKFIQNLHQHAKNGIILSWAIPGQGGHGHFNERSNEYVIEKLTGLGYTYDAETSNRLREISTLPWFKNTVMVFRKIVAE